MNLAQLIANILITSSYMILVGLGFSISYRTTKFFNLAYAFLFVVGPYFVLMLNSHLGLPLAVVLSVLLVGLTGVLLDVLVYRPLRHKNASTLILLLTSLGIYVILLNVISLIFGDESISIRLGKVEQGIDIFSAKITSIQIVHIGLSIATIIITSISLKFTRIGLAILAVSSSPELANVTGIQSEKIIIWTTLVSSIFIGLAGILVALDVNMNPTMGMNALLMGIIVVIIGGVGSIPGIALGALLLGLAQHLGVWAISSQWQDAIAFIILFIFLLFKPEGFMGKKVSAAKV